LSEILSRFSTPLDNFEDICNNAMSIKKILAYYLKTKSVFEKFGLQHTSKYGHLLFCISMLYEMQDNHDLANDYSNAAYACYKDVGYNGIWKEKALSRAERYRAIKASPVNY